jgi:hypothetical protein
MAWCLVKHRDNFTFKREEEAGGWRRPHNEELNNLYASLNIVRAIKSSIYIYIYIIIVDTLTIFKAKSTDRFVIISKISHVLLQTAQR